MTKEGGTREAAWIRIGVDDSASGSRAQPAAIPDDHVGMTLAQAKQTQAMLARPR